MHTLKLAIAITWGAFWVYWLASAFAAKEGAGRRRGIPTTALTAVAVLVVVRVTRDGSLAVESPVLAAIGAILFASGIALAVWGRLQLGPNWGMPMTEKAEPQLVTAGPYRLVRHPIYSGLLLAVIGTALATNLIGLLIATILGAYFYYCASVEERNLAATFPASYPAYRTSTKMLIPFLL